MSTYDFKYRRKLIFDLNETVSSATFNVRGLSMKLHKDVLLPHYCTDRLIEEVLDSLRTKPDIRTIVDLGTGSGFIALSIANAFPDRKVFATDICKKALEIACANAKNNNINNVTFMYNTDGEWLSEVKDIPIDLIVSNPPFIGLNEANATTTLVDDHPEVVYEPNSAIFTKDNEGFEPFIKIFENSQNMAVKEYYLQGSSSTLPRVAKMLKGIYGDKYKFNLVAVNGSPKVLVAKMIQELI